MKNKKRVGERIKKIRLSLGKTGDEFGMLIDPDNPPSQSTISKWERNVNLPNNKRLAKIAKEGGISVERLLKGTPREYIADKMTNELELDTRKVLPNQIVNYYTEELKSNEEYYPTDEEIIQAYNKIVRRREYYDQYSMLSFGVELDKTSEMINSFFDKLKTKNNNGEIDSELLKEFGKIAFYFHHFVLDSYDRIAHIPASEAKEEREELDREHNEK